MSEMLTRLGLNTLIIMRQKLCLELCLDSKHHYESDM